MRAMRSAMLLALMAPAAAMAQEASPPCPPGAPALPPELAGWGTKMQLAAAAAAGNAAGTALTIGRAATVTLLPTAEVAYPVPPGKPGGSGSHGGLLSFTIATAGSYRIALGAGAWIDVAQGGKLLASIAHGHGAACSGIRKTVDFALQPGRYLLEVAGSSDPRLDVMIARLP